MKCPRQILAGLEVDAGLAAHRAVHHREQRGGHLVEFDPAQINRRGETAQVADHAATHGEKHAAAIQALFGQKTQHASQRIQRLGPLAGRQHQRRRIGKHRPQRRALKRPDVAIRQDRDLPAGTKQNVHLGAHFATEGRPKLDRITPLAQVNGESLKHAMLKGHRPAPVNRRLPG